MTHELKLLVLLDVSIKGTYTRTLFSGGIYRFCDC